MRRITLGLLSCATIVLNGRVSITVANLYTNNKLTFKASAFDTSEIY